MFHSSLKEILKCHQKLTFVEIKKRNPKKRKENLIVLMRKMKRSIENLSRENISVVAFLLLFVLCNIN